MAGWQDGRLPVGKEERRSMGFQLDKARRAGVIHGRLGDRVKACSRFTVKKRAISNHCWHLRLVCLESVGGQSAFCCDQRHLPSMRLAPTTQHMTTNLIWEAHQ